MTAKEKIKSLKPGTRIKTLSGKIFTVVTYDHKYIYKEKETGLLTPEYHLEGWIGNHLLPDYDWETQFTVL